MKKQFLMLSVASVFFAACGDDVTQVNQTVGIEILAAGEKLGECTDKNAGEMKFVSDSSAVFYCAEGAWQPLKGEDGEPGDKGEPGEPGGPGEPGENGSEQVGTSCSAEIVDDTIKVSCDNEVVGVIENAGNGSNGANCGISKDKDGVVEITCGEGENAVTTTFYKALCGLTPYDPMVNFCLEGKTYPLCEGKTYNPSEMFCSEGDLFFMCNGATYDPAESFCSAGTLYSCDGKAYNPETQYCLELPSGEKNVEAYLFDNRDESNPQKYKTVTVGDQVWMAENLNFIPGNGLSKSFCNEDVDPTCIIYGRLYSWSGAMGKDDFICGINECNLPEGDIQGVCPDGWHIPSKTEWETVIAAAGGELEAGTKLKATAGWKSNGNGTDDYRFTGLAAGYRDDRSASFKKVGEEAYFWSRTEKDATSAYIVRLRADFAGVDLYGDLKTYAWSVRCVKNVD